MFHLSSLLMRKLITAACLYGITPTYMIPGVVLLDYNVAIYQLSISVGRGSVQMPGKYGSHKMEVLGQQPIRWRNITEIFDQYSHNVLYGQFSSYCNTVIIMISWFLNKIFPYSLVSQYKTIWEGACAVIGGQRMKGRVVVLPLGIRRFPGRARKPRGKPKHA